jgi:hypothetical protein
MARGPSGLHNRKVIRLDECIDHRQAVYRVREETFEVYDEDVNLLVNQPALSSQAAPSRPHPVGALPSRRSNWSRV